MNSKNLFQDRKKRISDQGDKFEQSCEKTSLASYKNQAAYLEDLETVFRKDYGVHLSESELKEMGRNIENLLMNFL